ncbi:MAG: class I SAM-dependent methyltransferase [Planctomycetota bacterium]
MATDCPSCASQDTEPFYEVRGVPVHDVQLMPTRQAALECPQGDIVLEFCRRCGFVFNSAFDASALEYATGYEDTQGFSPSFSAFAERLARRLIDRYELRDRDVLEIGCGKGEFLVLLCERGGNRGVGVDPTYVPGRAPPHDPRRVRFIRDLYSEQYADLEADFICCRHTLEHIPQVGDFIRMVRRGIGERTDTVLFFEVPDVTRVLEEGDFWDVYYEHCSYLAPASLRVLFGAAGFEVLELYLDYGDQYIMLTARPTVGGGRPGEAPELDSLARAVDQFRRRSAERIAHWREEFRRYEADRARAVIWGAGSKGVGFLTTLGLDEQVACAVDINPHKHGKFMPGTGHRVVPPQRLADYRPDFVVVMNPIYAAEIRQELDRWGVGAEIRTV